MRPGKLNNITELTVNASVADRDYKQTGDEGRDSVYKVVGVGLGKRFMENQVSVQGALTLFDESADDDVFSRNGTQPTAGVNWKAWDKGLVYANFSQRDYKHDDVEPLFNVKRDEREQQFVLDFRHEFKGDYLSKWVVDAKYSNTDNNSNVDIFTYDREVSSMTLSRSF